MSFVMEGFKNWCGIPIVQPLMAFTFQLLNLLHMLKTIIITKLMGIA